MSALKILIVFFLILILADTSFAGFIPKMFEGEFEQRIPTKQNNRNSKEQSTPKENFRKIPTLITYKYPGHIRAHAKDSGQETIYVCNATKVYMYTPPFRKGAKGTVNVGSSSKYCISKIFDVLSNGIKTNKSYVATQLGPKKYSLVFSKKISDQLGFYSIELEFEDLPFSFNNIKQIDTYPSKGKKAISWFKKSLNALKSIPAKTFEFEIPKNTDKIIMQ